MMNPHTNRTLHKNRTQTVPYKRHFQLLSRYAIGLFLLLAAALPVMAQGGLAEEPERMVLRFQAKAYLPLTGQLDEATRAALDGLLDGDDEAVKALLVRHDA